ncbi:DUF4180 domain-containing protein [Aurantivibrio plasticivorans]
MTLLARDHAIVLNSASDALAVIGSGLTGCIFTESDLHKEFFDLSNGVAGEVFQKFVNYGFKAAFIVPQEHDYGARITELMHDHQRHSTIRFFDSVAAAESWLEL